MKIIVFSFLSIYLLACQQGTDTTVDSSKVEKSPNILLIMVDDMGWTDIGPYGSEISTPNIDKLAKRGVLFTDFHTSISCSPTRSMLLTGTDNHLAGLGNMGELLAPNQIGQPGYEGHLNNNVVSLAEVLKQAGYQTFMAGKWHLGHDLDNIPGARGFEKSLSLLYGGASHFSDMAGLMVVENPAQYSMNGKKIKELPRDFYSSRSYTDFLISAIRDRNMDTDPFFAYLAFSAPHDPLQVPEPWMSKYRGAYDEGYERLRENRIKNAKTLNLVPEDAKVPRLHPAIKPWDSYSDDEKAYESRKMEVYAGMVENIDYHLGRMLSFLAEIQELDNTIILFLSDNGPNPWFNEQYPGNADGVYLSRFDNRIENLGNPTSHIAYGIGWAAACSGPLDYFKMTVGEGGIRSPLIIAGPQIPQGKTNHSFAYVTDLMPTILEIANVEHPDTFNGEKVLPIKGRSLLSVLSGERDYTYGPDEYIGGEMLNGKWMRNGNYKAELVTKPYGPDVWKLYDLSIDPGETTDISSEHPEILDELKSAWDKYADEVGVILGIK
jgi:arylsulfatase